MKSVMLTIRLKWFYLTYKGIKTIEVRKTAPKDFVGDVYEVVSKTNFEKDLMEIPENEREFFRKFKGKVGLKFTLNKVEETDHIVVEELLKSSCLTFKELDTYLNKKDGYGWGIDNLVIFDEPKELSEFTVSKTFMPKTKPLTFKRKLTKSPQSWCYVEV